MSLNPDNAALLLIDHQVGTMSFGITDPRFVAAVEKTGRKKLIMAGVSTAVCLTLPAVSAVRDGYEVYAVIDASGTFSEHALLASTLRMSQAGVVIANATMIVSELLADWSSKLAGPIGKILGARVANFGLVAAGFHRGPHAAQ